MRICTAPLLALALLVLGGCASIGPGSVNRDRFDYNVALTDSWKRQVLLNVVKLRYVEPISFVDVGQIVSAYTLETGGDFSATRNMYDRPGVTDSVNLKLGASSRFTDRPTITYTPLTGKTFLKSVMLPIPVQNLMQNIQSGASADIILMMSASNINGLRNEGVTTAGFRPADGRFLRVVALLRSLQLGGVLRVNMSDKGGVTLGFPKGELPQEVRDQINEFKTLLRLPQTTESFRVVGGHSTDEPGVIAVNCYSIMQILASMSIRVDIPEGDMKAGKATPGLQTDSNRLNPLGARIRSGPTEPEGPFTSVRFRDRWFWVDDTDLATKRLFSFILMAFTLTDESKHDSGVQLTLPAQ